LEGGCVCKKIFGTQITILGYRRKFIDTYDVYFNILIIFLGAPTHTPEVSAVLLTRLRRAPAPAAMSESISGVVDALQDSHKRSHTLDDESAQLLANVLKDEENFEPSQNGGSFSPITKFEKGNKISSLPE
jgi:hypothetical protein